MRSSPAQEATTDGGPDGRAISITSILWPLGLSLVVLIVISYYTFSFDTFKQLLRYLNPWLLAAALGTVATRIYFGALRLNYLSHGVLSIREGVRSQLAWDFFGAVTPSAVGGGPFIILFLSKDQDVPLGEATSLILFSTLLDLLWHASLILILLGMSTSFSVFPEAMGTVGYGAMLTAFALYLAYVCILAYSTLINPRFLTVLVAAVFRIRWIRRYRRRALRVMHDLQERADILRSQSRVFYVKGFVFSIIPWMSKYLLPVFLIGSVYPAVDWFLALLRAAALQVGALFLPTPGGAGAIEALYLLFFAPPVQPESLVAPTLLAWRFLHYYLFVFLGVFIAIQYVQRKVTSPPEPMMA